MTNITPINHLRLASANDAPLLTQEQLSNNVVMLFEQIITMQEDMIKLAEQQDYILETLKVLLNR